MVAGQGVAAVSMKRGGVLLIPPRRFAEYAGKADSVQIVIDQQSPPTRGRGLKLSRVVRPDIFTWSPPTRGRGLKQQHSGLAHIRLRRPPRGGVD